MRFPGLNLTLLATPALSRVVLMTGCCLRILSRSSGLISIFSASQVY